MPTTILLLTTGEQLEIDGAAEEVAKALENAARSSAGSMAWLRERGAGPLGVNPAQVVTVRTDEE